MADLIDLEEFLKSAKSTDFSSMIARDQTHEAEIETCVIAFADALPIGYETLTDDDLGELVRLASENEPFCAILRKLTVAMSS